MRTTAQEAHKSSISGRGSGGGAWYSATVGALPCESHPRSIANAQWSWTTCLAAPRPPHPQFDAMPAAGVRSLLERRRRRLWRSLRAVRPDSGRRAAAPRIRWAPCRTPARPARRRGRWTAQPPRPPRRCHGAAGARGCTARRCSYRGHGGAGGRGGRGTRAWRRWCGRWRRRGRA